MSFPRYPEYKDSGVEWLGAVPAHWEISRTDRLATTHRMSIAPADLDGKFVTHYSIPNVQEFGGPVLEDGSTIDSNKLIIIERQLLVSKLNPHKQVVIEATPDPDYLTVASTEFVPLVPHGVSDLDLNFLSYLWGSTLAMNRLLATADSATRSHQRVAPEEISKATWAWPTSLEQRAIVAFLDRETGKIDALVEEQKRLIELLKEKRQAVISQAVTKGLDPNVPMKDSGVEWLGEVPAHWGARLLKRAFASADYGISEQLDGEGSVAVLRMGNIANGNVLLDDLKYVEDVESDLLLQIGDLLFNRTNSLDLIGKVGLLSAVPSTPLSFASYLVRLRLAEGHDPKFFAYLLNINGVLGEARARALVAIGQCNLNPNRYGQIDVVLPPGDEQLNIAAFLDLETAKLDTLQAEAERAINLLKERRSALISATVTGKIDVRGLAPESEIVAA